jgi:hypothetical protein
MNLLNAYTTQYAFSLIYFYLLICCILDILPLKRSLPQFFTFYLPSLILITLTGFRVFGFSRDDHAYLEIYNHIDSFKFIELDRDIGYIFILKIFNNIFEYPDIFLYISLFFIIIKLFLLKKITINRNLSLVLLVYTTIYWQIHDVTQFRVSAAITFFLIFYFLTLKNYEILRFLPLLASISLHLQSIFYVFLLLKRTVISKIYLRRIIAISIFLGIGLNIYDIDNFIITFIRPTMELFWGYSRLETYLSMMNQGDFDHYRNFPYMLLFFLLALYWLTGEDNLQMSEGWAIISNSILLTIILSFVFFGLTDVQVRLYEQLLFVIVLIAGQIKKVSCKLILIMLSILNFYKFNISWNIFIF